ncbi:MAG: hypothetical protein UW87_C0009G0001, partial [Candidatus Moranbacteria bacterium GW2011_GWC2_45_10]
MSESRNEIVIVEDDSEIREQYAMAFLAE